MYLVEEVLHEGGQADVVIMAMQQKGPRHKAELAKGIVAVLHCLSPLFSHDACHKKQKKKTWSLTNFVSMQFGGKSLIGI